MKLLGNLPVKTQIPCTVWVFAGLITLFSLMQVSIKPAFESQFASATHLIAALR
jgi:hypothetical protein